MSDLGGADFDESESSWRWQAPGRRPLGQTQNPRPAWPGARSWPHSAHRQVNIVRMSFQSLPKTRVMIEAIGAHMVQTICRYSDLHFCILAAFFPLLNCNELSHNLFHLLAISEL